MQAHYELLQELGVAVPPMEFAAYKTMEGDMLLMQDAVYSAEANKELYIQRFKVLAHIVQPFWVSIESPLTIPSCTGCLYRQVIQPCLLTEGVKMDC